MGTLSALRQRCWVESWRWPALSTGVAAIGLIWCSTSAPGGAGRRFRRRGDRHDPSDRGRSSGLAIESAADASRRPGRVTPPWLGYWRRRGWPTVASSLSTALRSGFTCMAPTDPISTASEDRATGQASSGASAPVSIGPDDRIFANDMRDGAGGSLQEYDPESGFVATVDLAGRDEVRRTWGTPDGYIQSYGDRGTPRHAGRDIQIWASTQVLQSYSGVGSHLSELQFEGTYSAIHPAGRRLASVRPSAVRAPWGGRPAVRVGPGGRGAGSG